MESSIWWYVVGATVVLAFFHGLIRAKNGNQNESQSNADMKVEGSSRAQENIRSLGFSTDKITSSLSLETAILSRKPLNLLLPNRLQVLGSLCLRDYVSARQRGELVFDDEPRPTTSHIFFESRGHRHIKSVSTEDESLSLDFFDTFLTISARPDLYGGGIYLLAPHMESENDPLDAIYAEIKIMDFLLLSRSSEGKSLLLSDCECLLRSIST
jgi:hypothetical protein